MKRVSVTPRGAGSSLEGNSVPSPDSVVLDLSRMDRILEVRPEDFYARVEPGIIYNDLNRRIKETGLFFPPSPGGSSDMATIGGMVNTNASGIYSIKYGGTRNYVRSMVLVDGTGTVRKLGTLAPKMSSGLDLVDLVVGSEGLLGIVTEVTLGLAPRPEAFRKLAFSFSDDAQTARSIVLLKQSLPELAAVEFLDASCMEAVNRFKSYSAVVAPALFLEVHAAADRIDRVAESASALCRGEGGTTIDLGGVDPWEFRHHVTRAIRACNPGSTIVRNDAGFPVSLLPEVVETCRDWETRIGLRVYAFGHAGLGILHVLIPAPEKDRPAMARATEAKREIIHFALSRGGTTSAEHGIGLGQKSFMRREHGSTLTIMRDIKRVFDPRGIMNPDKVLPAG